MIFLVAGHTMSPTWLLPRSRIVLCTRTIGARRVPLLSGIISMVHTYT
ncbi:hypothetical protein LINGRAHAP2_LOCUS32332 [Linum grandiflorum]